MNKHTLKFDNLNLYICSLTLGLLQYMKASKNYDLGIWTLGMPMFKQNLKKKGVDQRLINIIEVFDELSAIEAVDLDVEKFINGKIEIITQIIDDQDCYNKTNEIILE